MNRKFYIQPQVRTTEVRPAQVLAVSIKNGTADPNEEILVKKDEGNLFHDEFFDFTWE